MIRSSRSTSKTRSWDFGEDGADRQRGQGARTDRPPAPEFALLDVSFNREEFAVAERLEALKSPPSSGYGADTLPRHFASKPDSNPIRYALRAC
jgi:hypothetical protein